MGENVVFLVTFETCDVMNNCMIGDLYIVNKIKTEQCTLLKY